MTIEDLDLYDHYPRLKAAKALETPAPRAVPTLPTETPTPGEARSVEALRAVVTTLAQALTTSAGPASTMAYRVERRRLIDAAVSMLQVLRGQS